LAFLDRPSVLLSRRSGEASTAAPSRRSASIGWVPTSWLRPSAAVFAITAALALAVDVRAHPGTQSAARPLVPRGDLLVGDHRGRLLVLNRTGKLVRRLPRARLVRTPQAIELAPDRRHAFISVHMSEQPARLYDVDLATGAKRLIANAISPALSPQRTQLAYVTIARRPNSEIIDRTALVIRNLRTGHTRSIPFAPNVPLGTPPELIINWSPDGTTIAVFDGRAIRLVDVASATTLPSQPLLPGDTPTPGRTSLLAPVFLNGGTLIVLAGCCIGPQQLVAVDLSSGGRESFAKLSSPPENLKRLKPGLLLTVTALNELVIVSRGHSRVIARGIVAAAG